MGDNTNTSLNKVVVSRQGIVASRQGIVLYLYFGRILYDNKCCVLLLLLLLHQLLLESSFTFYSSRFFQVTFTSNQVVLKRLTFTSTQVENKSSSVTPVSNIA